MTIYIIFHSKASHMQDLTSPEDEDQIDTTIIPFHEQMDQGVTVHDCMQMG